MCVCVCVCVCVCEEGGGGGNARSLRVDCAQLHLHDVETEVADSQQRGLQNVIEKKQFPLEDRACLRLSLSNLQSVKSSQVSQVILSSCQLLESENLTI